MTRTGGSSRKARAPKRDPGWWVRLGETVRGPVSTARLRTLLRQGKVHADAEVSRDRETWYPAETALRRGFRFRRPRSRTAGWEIHRVMREHVPVPYVTYALIGLNLFVFFVQLAGGFGVHDPTQVIDWGANYGPATARGEWWRLLTSMFLHYGVMHLVGNMLFLWYLGRFAERLFGHVGLGVIYLAGGLAGGVVSILAYEDIISAGASGAVYAVIGSIIGFVMCRREDRTLVRAFGKAWTVAVVYIALDMTLSFLGPGYGPHATIDLAAHAAGLAMGIALGYALGHPLTEEGVRLRVPRAIVAGVAALAVVAGTTRLIEPKDDVVRALARLERAERALPHQELLGWDSHFPARSSVHRMLAPRVADEHLLFYEEALETLEAIENPGPRWKRKLEQTKGYLRRRVRECIKFLEECERSENEPLEADG